MRKAQKIVCVAYNTESVRFGNDRFGLDIVELRDNIFPGLQHASHVGKHEPIQKRLFPFQWY